MSTLYKTGIAQMVMNEREMCMACIGFFTRGLVVEVMFVDMTQDVFIAVAKELKYWYQWPYSRHETEILKEVCGRLVC